MLNYHNCLTEKEKITVSYWKYDGEYAIYNLPAQDKQKKEQREFIIRIISIITMLFMTGMRL